jgi:UDP-glucose 4-epimerase
MHKTSPRVHRCLVSGGAGFIGSHIVEALARAGHPTAVVDDLSSGQREHLDPQTPIHVLDITGDTSAAFREFRPDILIHQAAQVSVSVSMRSPEEDARTNILGSIRIIRTALEFGVKKILYASSAAVYGPLETLPFVETMRPLPVSAYGISKHTVEHYLRAAAKDWGLEEWAALRYANVYGPRQNPHGEAGVVAIFSQKLLRGEPPTIFDDGELTRDYIFVGDVARANLAALDADLRGHPDPVFNISTAKETSTNQIFRGLERHLDSRTPARYAPPRAGDVRRSLLDNRKAGLELGWRPQVDLEEGLKLTARYFMERVESR